MHACHIENILQEHGLRRTRDRHSIMALFDEDRAWSVAQLHASLPRMDLSTVYRNVQKLQDGGILSAVHVHGKETFYELADKEHHDHLVCGSCETAECIPCPVEHLPSSHTLELFGTCTSCERPTARA